MTDKNTAELQKQVLKVVRSRLAETGFTPAPTNPTPRDSERSELQRAS